MNFVDFLLLGIGLSMDAFAVSVCKGLKMPKINLKQTLVISLFFGGFQALMPLIGWFLGSKFSDSIQKIDHWIAFLLLAFIGGKMIFEAFHENKSEEEETAEFDIKELFLMAVATSIDALAVGIVFAMQKADIFGGITVIGLTTFLISGIGVFIGHKFGERYKTRAETVGGVILILIGLKILIEDLFV